jgi:hypothetical protein
LRSNHNDKSPFALHWICYPHTPNILVNLCSIEAMRGDVSAESTPEKGSTFAFTLPRAA